MIRVIDLKTNKEFRMKMSDYRERRATAYHAGSMGHPITCAYSFEEEAWRKGAEEGARIRQEIKEGLR